MDIGNLPFRYVGKHRRASLKDVLALKAKIDASAKPWKTWVTMPRISISAMAFDPVVAVCDACIPYPFHLRNVIVQAAVDRLFHARWTDAIHDEWMQNLIANTPELSPDRLMAAKRLMDLALPEARIAGYEQHIPTINLPDPDDRHVAAAAIAAGASTIITWNLRDFPVGALRKHNLVRQTPDAFPGRSPLTASGAGHQFAGECPAQSQSVMCVSVRLPRHPARQKLIRLAAQIENPYR